MVHIAVIVEVSVLAVLAVPIVFATIIAVVAVVVIVVVVVVPVVVSVVVIVVVGAFKADALRAMQCAFCTHTCTHARKHCGGWTENLLATIPRPPENHKLGDNQRPNREQIENKWRTDAENK